MKVMKKIRRLPRFERRFVTAIALMVALFTVLYIAVTLRSGIIYNGAFLVRSKEGNSTVYSGKLKGTDMRFTIDEAMNVTYQYGDKRFTPYTLKEVTLDESDKSRGYKGVEIWQNGELIYYVKVVNNSVYGYSNYETGGQSYFFGFDAPPEEQDSPDKAPSPQTAVKFAYGLDKTHKGSWLLYAIGLIISILSCLQIIYADELFRFNMSFFIRNSAQAEPSEYEMVTRELRWVMLPILALIIFIVGLNVPAF